MEEAYARPMQEEMERQIEENKPKYIVVVSPHPILRTSWLWYPDKSHMELFGWMDDWVRSRYHVEGLVHLAPVQVTPQGPLQWQITWLWDTEGHPDATTQVAGIEKQLAGQWAFQQDVLLGRKPAPTPPAQMPQFYSDFFLGRDPTAAAGAMPQARPPWFVWEMPVVVVLRANEAAPSGAGGRKPCTAPGVSSTRRTSAMRSATNAAGPICRGPTSTWASWCCGPAAGSRLVGVPPACSLKVVQRVKRRTGTGADTRAGGPLEKSW